ncbi:MAG: hypothetical protein ACHP7J_01390 [Terriglobales bacterium]
MDAVRDGQLIDLAKERFADSLSCFCGQSVGEGRGWHSVSSVGKLSDLTFCLTRSFEHEWTNGGNFFAGGDKKRMREWREFRPIVERVIKPFRGVPKPRVAALQAEVIPSFPMVRIEKSYGDFVGGLVGQPCILHANPKGEFAPVA